MITAMSTNTTTNTAPAVCRVGLKKTEVEQLLKNYKFPASAFTVKQAYDEIGARHWLIRSYIKKNAQVVGDAQKVAGTNGKARGKAAKLYLLPEDKRTY